METRTRTWYAMRCDNNGRFDNGWLMDTAKTLQEAKEIIDMTNDRAEKQGYKRREYMITKVIWKQVMEHGRFKSVSKYEEAVEIYGL